MLIEYGSQAANRTDNAGEPREPSKDYCGAVPLILTDVSAQPHHTFARKDKSACLAAFLPILIA